MDGTQVCPSQAAGSNDGFHLGATVALVTNPDDSNGLTGHNDLIGMAPAELTHCDGIVTAGQWWPPLRATVA